MQPRRCAQRGQELRAARARRGGFPHRREVELPAQQPLAALRGGQRRRIRAGHLQGPRDHGKQPLPVPGRADDRLPTPCRPTLAYIYLRGEFWQIAHELDEKIAELEAAGLLGDNLFGTEYSLRLYTHLGAGAYICGEETALLESLEGKLGQPRLRPPFPAVVRACTASRP